MHEIWAYQEQHKVGAPKMLKDISVEFIARSDLSVVPDIDDSASSECS
jgi:hypothetical protein